MTGASRLLRGTAHAAIRTYQLTLSGFSGRQCRYLPTCSDYADEAIQRHGLWAGGWMGLARICRCQPWGGAGFDPVPAMLRPDADWPTPWRYGEWRYRDPSGRPPLTTTPAPDGRDQDRASSSAASP